MPKQEMLINDTPGEECRIAIIQDGQLEELYQERASSESHVGNIYKGKVAHIEPSIQAAFIDFGLERSGFLHLSDLHPMYFGGSAKEDSERIGKKTPHRDRPPIQNCLRRGQDILVQVIKEGIGTKGPTLTSYLSIPGRFLVVLPYMERLGVSRKVEDDESRHKMREILDELNPPKEFGFIIRTAGIGRTKADLKRDLAYLQRLWKTIEKRMETTSQVGELYTESDLVIRTIRDVFSADIDRIVIDNEAAAHRAKSFLAIANPRSGSKVVVYRDPVPLFHRYDIERQIETIHGRVVPLPSGGSLVIDSTEALVAIDVNSGKSRDSRDAETNAYKINLEAADEVCRQLRLRDLGGVVVIDLIDMRPLKHRREIEQRFRANLKNDRARTQVSPISQFGILEMTRQRMRPSLKKSIYTDCPSCKGAGLVKSAESVVLDVTRRLALIMHKPDVTHVELTISPDVAFYLLNRKRKQLTALEQQHNKSITVRVGGGSLDFIQLDAFNANGSKLEAELLSAIPSVKSAPPVEADLQELGATPQPSQNTPPQPDGTDAEADKPKPRRRRRRRGGRSKQAAASNDDSPSDADNTTGDAKPPTTVPSTEINESDSSPLPEDADGNTISPAARPRRRRRRGGRKKTSGSLATDQPKSEAESNAEQADTTQDNAPSAKPKSRRRRRPRSSKASDGKKPVTAVPIVTTDQNKAPTATGESST
jgi:ribonuclease E